MIFPKQATHFNTVKNIFFSFSLTLFSRTVLFLLSFFQTTATFPQILQVCRDACAFTDPTKAVQASKPNDLIEIAAGTYPVFNLVLKHPLRLKGLPQTNQKVIFDGAFKGQILRIKNTQNVQIENIHFQRSGLSYVEDLSAVNVENSSNCLFRNNSFSENYVSVLVQKSHHCIFENNKIVGRDENSAIAGNGLHLWYAHHIKLLGNKIENHRDGIYFEFVNDSTIEDNFSTLNQRYGLHFMFSHQNEFRRNQFVKNGAGVAVMYSRQILMEKNTFSKNLGSAAYGLLLKDISSSQIQNNHILENSIGIYMEGSNRNSLQHNNLIHNGYALKIMADCENNLITLNNFKSNTFQVTTNSAQSQNSFKQNYWSDYRGLDLNRDGFGDLPYRPVKLSSLLLEQLSVSLFLVRSFFLDLADLAEEMIPDMTPVDLKDSQPLLTEII